MKLNCQFYLKDFSKQTEMYTLRGLTDLFSVFCFFNIVIFATIIADVFKYVQTLLTFYMFFQPMAVCHAAPAVP